jgi:hypothetical protein
MQSATRVKGQGEDSCVMKVNLYFKRLNVVFINNEGDAVTISFFHEKYSCSQNNQTVRYEGSSTNAIKDEGISILSLIIGRHSS